LFSGIDVSYERALEALPVFEFSKMAAIAFGIGNSALVKFCRFWRLDLHRPHHHLSFARGIQHIVLCKVFDALAAALASNLLMGLTILNQTKGCYPFFLGNGY